MKIILVNKKTADALKSTVSTALSGGAQTRNRTKDTGIFSPLLYQLSYLSLLLNGGPSGT